MTLVPVGWGFLGAGFIASRALAPAVHSATGAVLSAVAARDASRAQVLEPARVVTDYRSLLDDSAVEVVYVSLTNEAHLPWVVSALEAGKHVLCEKPLGLTADEVATMQQAAELTGRLLVEATANRWHPRTRRLEGLLREGAVGAVRHVAAGFTFDGVPADNYRLRPERGGGALYDVGCYAVAAAIWASSSPVTAVRAVTVDLGGTGVDLTTQAELELGTASAAVRASIAEPERQWLTVRGETGRLELPGSDAFTSWHAASHLDLDAGGEVTRERFEACDPYQLMVEDVSAAVRGQAADRQSETRWLPDPAGSLAVADALDAIRLAAAGGDR